MPWTPNWPLDYTPTPAEWANAFAAKVDYPAPVNQGGTGAENAAAANYALAQRGLIGISPYDVDVLTVYGVRTGLGAITINLPPLSSVAAGDWLQLFDIDYAASTNNISVAAYISDTIALYDSSAATQTLNVAGVAVLLTANVSAWRMTVL